MNELKHIAIIMDGNGRWAKSRNLVRSLGHIEGAKNIKRIANYCADNDIKYLSLYAFSTENWKRAKEEVDKLMFLFNAYLRDVLQNLSTIRFAIKIIGTKTGLSKEQIELIDKVEEETKNNNYTLGICFNYGGQGEIVDAVNKLIADGKTSITKEDITNNIYTGIMPPPDMIIRTGNEKRLSNFFLWQSAYSELFFTSTLWPDFDENELNDMIKEYYSRTRKFGDAK